MTVLLIISFSTILPQGVIKGKITDKLSNEPLIGATITIVNENLGDISDGFERSGISIRYDSSEAILNANEEKTIFVKLIIPSGLNFHIPYENRHLNCSNQVIAPYCGFNLNKDTMKKYNRILLGITIQFFDELGFRHHLYHNIHLTLE